MTAPMPSARDTPAGVHPCSDYCIVECSGQVFAAGLSAVREVLSGKLATPVPQAPPALIGVVELRGDVLPVVQLSALLGIPTRAYTPANPILVLSSHDARVGVVVDRVRHVRAIESVAITATKHDLFSGWCTGTTPRVGVLNADALVAHAMRTIAASFQPGFAGTHASGARSGG